MEFPGALVLVTHDRWLLDRVSNIILALDGTGRADWFADYAQWEMAQERRNSAAASLDDRNADTVTRTDGTRRREKFSYRDQKEWATIETDILKAEAQVADCEAAMNDLAVLSDATKLGRTTQPW